MAIAAILSRGDDPKPVEQKPVKKMPKKSDKKSGGTDYYVDCQGHPLAEGRLSDIFSKELRFKVESINLLLKGRYFEDLRIRIEDVNGVLYYVLYRESPDTKGKFIRDTLLNPVVMKDFKRKNVVVEPTFEENGLLIPLPYGYTAGEVKSYQDQWRYLEVYELELSKKGHFFVFIPYQTSVGAASKSEDIGMKKSSWIKSETILEISKKMKKKYQEFRVPGSEVDIYLVHPFDYDSFSSTHFQYGRTNSVNGVSVDLFGGGKPTLNDPPDPEKKKKPSRIKFPSFKDISPFEIPKNFPLGVEISIVIDTSGSMDKHVDDYWAYFRHRWEDVPAFFRLFFTVSIVIEAAEGPKVLMPPTKMTEAGIAEMKKALEAIHFSGGTERFEKGINQAKKLVKFDQRGKDKVLREVVVLTDQEGRDSHFYDGISIVNESDYKRLREKIEKGQSDRHEIKEKREALYRELRDLGYSEEIAANISARLLSLSPAKDKDPIYQSRRLRKGSEIVMKLVNNYKLSRDAAPFVSGLERLFADYKKSRGLETVTAMAVGALSMIPSEERIVWMGRLKNLVLEDIDFDLQRAAVAAIGLMVREGASGAHEALTDLEAKVKGLCKKDRMERKVYDLIKNEVEFSVDLSDRAKDYISQLEIDPDAVSVEDIKRCGFNEYTVGALIFVIENSMDSRRRAIALDSLIGIVEHAAKAAIYNPENPLDVGEIVTKIDEFIKVGMYVEVRKLERLNERFREYTDVIEKKKRSGKTVSPKKRNKRFPEIKGHDYVSREKVKLSDVAKDHRFTFVVFWDDYVPNCERLLDKLNSLKREYGKDVGVFAVSTDRSTSAYRLFKSKGYRFPSVSVDRTDLPYPIDAVPTTLIIDSKMNIRQRIFGDVLENNLRGTVDELMLKK